MRLRVVRGYSIRLPAEFFSGDLPADPLNPRVRVVSPSNAVVVSNALPYRDGIGLYHYDFFVRADASLGAWTAHWTGTINGEIVGGVDGFEVLPESAPELMTSEGYDVLPDRSGAFEDFAEPLMAVVPSSTTTRQRGLARPAAGRPPKAAPAPVKSSQKAQKPAARAPKAASVPGRFKRSRVTKVVLGITLAIAVLALTFVTKSPPSTTTKAFQLAEQALRAGQTEQARLYYLSILDEDRSNKYAYFDLGLIAQSAGRATEATYYYRRALARDLNFLPALFNLAIVEEAGGQNLEAGVIYRQILRAHPEHAASHFNLGLLLKNKLGRPVEGQAEIDQAIKLDPSLATRIGAVKK